ncbi:MAG TPA: hypothetical protein VK821_04240 [Dehalococcoidia bacterium]|nr:hypothetical protein [Dehalococcoidia bacterium]
MTTQTRRRVPVYSDGTAEYYIYLGVEADEGGEPWLEPHQVSLLDKFRIQVEKAIANTTDAVSQSALSIRAAGKTWRIHRAAG